MDDSEGAKTFFYDFAHQKPSIQSETVPEQIALVQNDHRWPALLDRLNQASKEFGLNASFNPESMQTMQDWTGFSQPFNGDWRPYVWDIVVVDRMTAEALNSSVFEPVRLYYPNVQMSNFAHHYHTDPSRDVRGTTWWPFASTSAVAAAGTGSHVGTHQSMSYYGGSPWKNYSHVLRSQSVTNNFFHPI